MNKILGSVGVDKSNIYLIYKVGLINQAPTNNKNRDLIYQTHIFYCRGLIYPQRFDSSNPPFDMIDDEAHKGLRD